MIAEDHPDKDGRIFAVLRCAKVVRGTKIEANRLERIYIYSCQPVLYAVFSKSIYYAPSEFSAVRWPLDKHTLLDRRPLSAVCY